MKNLKCHTFQSRINPQIFGLETELTAYRLIAVCNTCQSEGRKAWTIWPAKGRGCKLAGHRVTWGHLVFAPSAFPTTCQLLLVYFKKVHRAANYENSIKKSLLLEKSGKGGTFIPNLHFSQRHHRNSLALNLKSSTLLMEFFTIPEAEVISLLNKL